MKIHLEKHHKAGILIFLLLLFDLLNGSQFSFYSSFTLSPITLPKILISLSILIFIFRRLITNWRNTFIKKIGFCILIPSFTILILTQHIEKYQYNRTQENLNSICYEICRFSEKEKRVPENLREVGIYSGNKSIKSYYRMYNNTITYKPKGYEFELSYISKYGEIETINNCFSNLTSGQENIYINESYINDYIESIDQFDITYHNYSIDRTKTRYSILGDSIVELFIYAKYGNPIIPNQTNHDTDTVILFYVKNIKFGTMKNIEYDKSTIKPDTTKNIIQIGIPFIRDSISAIDKPSPIDTIKIGIDNVALIFNGLNPASTQIMKKNGRITIIGTTIIDNEVKRLNIRLNL